MRRVALIAVLLVTSITTSNAAELLGLGWLAPNEPGKWSTAAGVSEDGLVAVGSSGSYQSRKQAFRWTQLTAMIGLGFLDNTSEWSEASAVSCDGSVIVGRSHSSSGIQAFRWTQQNGMQPLGFLATGTPESAATAVSCDGSVVAGYSMTPLGREAFRWTSAGGMVGLGDLHGGAFFSEARGISDDGNVIAGASDSGEEGGLFEAFIWTPQSGMHPMGDVSGSAVGLYNSFAFAVAGNSTSLGDAVVIGKATGEQASLWTLQNGVGGLGFNIQQPYQGIASFGYATTNSGNALVGRWVFDNGVVHENRAMIWDDSGAGMRDFKTSLNAILNPQIAYRTLLIATGMSGSGQVIVGDGRNPDHVIEAWLVRVTKPTPKPFDWEKTNSHIICCYEPPIPQWWVRVFDGSASGTTPECAPLVSREWDFGDGEKGTGEIARHTYRQPGLYRVQLTVRDRCRGSAVDVVEVEIAEER